MVWLPDNEDVGVFVGDIVFLLQEAGLRSDSRVPVRVGCGQLSSQGLTKEAKTGRWVVEGATPEGPRLVFRWHQCRRQLERATTRAKWYLRLWAAHDLVANKQDFWGGGREPRVGH